jgi:ferric-dicitrate binding protein FerR (iron transport regulator)
MDNQQEYMCLIVERYLRGEATKSERELMQLWLASDPTFADWLSEHIDNQQPEMDDEVRNRIYHRITDRDFVPATVPSPRRFKIAHMLSVAAVIIMAVTIGWTVSYVSRVEPTPVTFAIATGIGEHPSVTLPDGTVVNISPMSRLSYTFDESQHSRRVTLSGQAYFDVAHDTINPFTVETESLNIRCLGTAFNVKAYSGEETESIILYQGKVSVTADDSQEIMLPDTRLIYDRVTDQFTKHPVVADNYPISGRGRMFFDNETLSDIARTFYRQLGVRITIEGADLATQRFYGSIVATDAQTALSVLASATGTHMQYQGDSLVVMSHAY